MNHYTVPALRDKRARIAGEIEALQKQVLRLIEDLNSLDQTIALFDPDYKVGSIRPIKPLRRIHLFRTGQLGRIILSALRTAKHPMRTAEFITIVALAIGQDKSANNVIRGTVSANLNYLARRGKIVKIGERGAARWELVKEMV
jgi:hypothetical protein